MSREIQTFVSSNGFVVAASEKNAVTCAPRRGSRVRFVVLVHGRGQATHLGRVLTAQATARALDALDDAPLASWVRGFAAGEASS